MARIIIFARRLCNPFPFVRENPANRAVKLAIAAGPLTLLHHSSRGGEHGRAPEDIEPFLPWNLSDERREALAMHTSTPATIDTS